MIEKTQGWKVGEMFFATLAAAQAEELARVFDCPNGPDIARKIIDHATEVRDILTTTPDSRPKARRIHGGTKPRKAKAPEVAT